MMFNKLIKTIRSFTKSFYLILDAVDVDDKGPIFKVRDFGQINPYILSSQQILDFRIINQLQAKDAYTVGCVITTNNYNKLKYNRLIIDNKTENITLKSNTSSHHDEFSGNIEQLLQNSDYLENCTANVITSLISLSYNLGKEDGIKASFATIAKPDINKENTTQTDNIVYLQQNTTRL